MKTPFLSLSKKNCYKNVLVKLPPACILCPPTTGVLPSTAASQNSTARSSSNSKDFKAALPESGQQRPAAPSSRKPRGHLPLVCPAVPRRHRVAASPRYLLLVVYPTFLRRRQASARPQRHQRMTEEHIPHPRKIPTQCMSSLLIWAGTSSQRIFNVIAALERLTVPGPNA